MKTKFIHLALTGLVALAFVGCGGSKKEETPSAQPAASAPAGGKTVDAATAGSVSGKVTLEGKAPALKAINMSAEPYCMKAHSSPVIPPEVVVGEKGALENVVVYVKDSMGDYVFETPKASVELDQKGCMYDPHVIAAMAGQTIEVKNDDQTTHNIHPTPKDNREWNQSQPPGAAPLDEQFARMEVAIPVKCNVHPWMKGYIAVFKNPFFAVTTKDGKFDIKGLPPGTYTIEAWQEKFGTMDQQVTVGPKESKTVSFAFKPTSGD